MVYLFWKDVILLKSHNTSPSFLQFYNEGSSRLYSIFFLRMHEACLPCRQRTRGDENQELQQLPANVRSQKGSLSGDMLRASRMIQSCCHFDLELFSSTTIRKMNFYCFKSSSEHVVLCYSVLKKRSIIHETVSRHHHSTIVFITTLN